MHISTRIWQLLASLLGLASVARGQLQCYAILPYRRSLCISFPLLIHSNRVKWNLISFYSDPPLFLFPFISRIKIPDIPRCLPPLKRGYAAFISFKSSGWCLRILSSSNVALLGFLIPRSYSEKALTPPPNRAAASDCFRPSHLRVTRTKAASCASIRSRIKGKRG